MLGAGSRREEGASTALLPFVGHDTASAPNYQCWQGRQIAVFKPHVKYAVCRRNASLTIREGELHGIVTLCLSAVLGGLGVGTQF